MATDIDLAVTIAQLIRTLGTVPSGHLYAQVMNLADLEGYNRAIEILLRTKLITRKHHILTWTGD